MPLNVGAPRSFRPDHTHVGACGTMCFGQGWRPPGAAWLSCRKGGPGLSVWLPSDLQEGCFASRNNSSRLRKGSRRDPGPLDPGEAQGNVRIAGWNWHTVSEDSPPPSPVTDPRARTPVMWEYVDLMQKKIASCQSRPKLQRPASVDEFSPHKT